MSFLTLKINSTDRNSIIEDFVYSNSLKGNPTIDINPSDVDNALFEIGNEIQIYNGATKLLSGSIKDLTSLWYQGINTKTSRIHVRDLKEKIFSADLTAYTGLTNLQALTYICSQSGVTLSTSVTTTNKYAMEKLITSKSFWSYVREICISEGWGCYCNNDTLYVTDVIGSSSSYTLTNMNQIEHEYNELNSYSNVVVKGVINKDRLLSDEDNPYSSVLDYLDTTTIETISITCNNESDFFSILSGSSDIDNFTLENGNNISFTIINASSITDTFDLTTSTLENESTNFNINSYEKILYSGDDQICEQCEAIKINGFVVNRGEEVNLNLIVTGKKIDTYSSENTPDTFLTIFKDLDATEIGENRYLYYENRNVTNNTQISNIISSLARETSKRVLKLNLKVNSDHVFNLLDRLYINEGIEDIDGYWSVFGFTCRRNVRNQEWQLELVRSNTIIIPELNLYSKRTILDYIKYSDKTLRGIVVDEANNKYFIPEIKQTIYATNDMNLELKQGDGVFLRKNKEWNVISKVENEIINNINKIRYIKGESDVINDYNGGYNSVFNNAWSTGFTDLGAEDYEYEINEAVGSFQISSYTTTHLIDDIFSISITFTKNVDPNTANLNTFVIARN